MWSDIRDLDLETTIKDKVLYVAVALPALGVLGTALRASGLSREIMFMIVVPLLYLSFVAWHLGRAVQRARNGGGSSRHDGSRQRHSRSARYRSPRLHARAE